MRLQHLGPNQILPTDWVAIHSAQKRHYSQEGPVELEEQLNRGLSQVWQLVGAETRVLIVTSRLEHPSGAELRLRFIAGKGWFKHFGDILPLLEELAIFAGCRFFGGLVRGKKAYQFYEKLGGKVQGVYVYKDLENVGRTEHDYQGDTLETSPAGFGSGSLQRH